MNDEEKKKRVIDEFMVEFGTTARKRLEQLYDEMYSELLEEKKK